MAYHALRKHPESQDIVQEIFTSLWNNRKKVKIESVAAYLYSATRKQVLKVAVAGQGRVEFLDQIELIRLDHSADEEMALAELQTRLEESMALLPPKCRQIFELNRFDHRSVKEIAEMLSLSPKTVENQIFKATTRLRGSLGEYFFVLLILFYPSR